jgi:[methyl-Co(III) methanol-specific corrinoid protein]:coenzyme M methyltransferase
MQLMQKYQRGNRPTFHLGPFLPITGVRESGLSFNDVFRDAETMTAVARMSFELGFESTVVPFDLNVEAEILGAGVCYHAGFDGHPVYPTITHRPVADAEDITIPTDIRSSGRMPAILHTIRALKNSDSDPGAVGAFIPGPFTLAGQVMEPERLFIMLLKNPDQARSILERLTDFINALKSVYAGAGVDFMVVEEGGAASVSPRIFGKLLLPNLQSIFAEKPCPMVVSFTGGTEPFLEFLLACNPDGINIDRQCDTAGAREKIPASLPLFTGCGAYDMLANAETETIAEAVRCRLDQGAAAVGPPADIYPPAKMENIAAFIRAVREYQPGLR